MDVRERMGVAGGREGALKHEGIVIERRPVVGGNLGAPESVPAEAVIGRLMAATGWRIRLDPGTES